MQKILIIQCAEKTGDSSLLKRRSLVEDFEKKYTNLKLRRISLNSPEKPEPSRVTVSQKPSKIEIKEVRPKLKSSTVEQNSQELKIPEPARSFMCISCSEKFQKFSLLECHLKSCKVSTTQQFKCFCGTVLSSKKDLSLHVSIQHKQNKQQHICTICKKIFTSVVGLQNHMIVHKSPPIKSKSVFMCHVCNSKHSDLEHLKSHRVTCRKKSSEI